MDNLDFGEPVDYRQRSTSGMIWNVLTVLVLLSVVCLAIIFFMVFINPNSGLNPFPPPTIPAALQFPTETPTPRGLLPPTWTPEPTNPPTETPTPRPSATLPPSPTFFSLVPGEGITETVTVEPAAGGMPFVLKGEKYAAIENFAYPEAGCNWMGVAGRVFDLRDSVILGQQVQLGGVLPGAPGPGDFSLTLTGLATTYGAGFYEFTLANRPIASQGTLWLQVLDQQGLPMSDKVYFDTYAECDQNLLLIDFEQVR
jgi:hypothetical protein